MSFQATMRCGSERAFLLRDSVKKKLDRKGEKTELMHGGGDDDGGGGKGDGGEGHDDHG